MQHCILRACPQKSSFLVELWKNKRELEMLCTEAWQRSAWLEAHAESCINSSSEASIVLTGLREHKVRALRDSVRQLIKHKLGVQPADYPALDFKFLDFAWDWFTQ